MEKFNDYSSIAVPLMIPNIDTDIISPMKRLILNPDELDVYSFEALRFENGDGDSGRPDMSFPLNMEKYKNAEILIVGENFGCGSSRETAAEAIRKCGYRSIISSSFAGIFVKNCFEQGILPITLKKDQVETLAERAERGEPIRVSLTDRKVITSDGTAFAFEIDDFRRELLLEGRDSVDVTLDDETIIKDFFEKDKEKREWLYI